MFKMGLFFILYEDYTTTAKYLWYSIPTLISSAEISGGAGDAPHLQKAPNIIVRGPFSDIKDFRF